MGCCESRALDLNELTVEVPALRTQLTSPNQQQGPSPARRQKLDEYWREEGVAFDEVTNTKAAVQTDFRQAYRRFGKNPQVRGRPHAISVHSSSETSCSGNFKRTQG
jgi:hypothetical protein